MQSKHKFNTGDIVRLKDTARNWNQEAYGKDHIYGEDLIYEDGYPVRHCVNEYPDDFILVKKHFTKTEVVEPKTKPHKHAELIKKWADGAKIEYYDNIADRWDPIVEPNWDLGTLYREAKGREFPETSLSFSRLQEEYRKGYTGIESLFLVANLAIKQYILDMEKDNVD